MEPRSIIRWQHRLNREHPTCTERTKALIEECGWKGGDSGDSAGKKQCDQHVPKRIPLTPTGLLMEGDFASYPEWQDGPSLRRPPETGNQKLFLTPSPAPPSGYAP